MGLDVGLDVGLNLGLDLELDVGLDLGFDLVGSDWTWLDLVGPSMREATERHPVQ